MTSTDFTPAVLKTVKAMWRQSALNNDLPPKGKRRDTAAFYFAIGAASAVHAAIVAGALREGTDANLTGLAFLVSVRGASVLDAD